MLNEGTKACLSALTYRADAERQISILPLGSIYFGDEMPNWHQLIKLPEDDRRKIFQTFSLRYRIWDHQGLSEEDQLFWEAMRSTVPTWAVFQRLALSEEDKRAREEVERNCAKEFEEFLADANLVTVAEGRHGLHEFSLTFRLDKNQASETRKPSWCSRLLQKFKRSKPT